MNKLRLLRTLEEIGLDDKEARVYLAALALGPSSILKIANEAAVKRTTVYSLLSALRTKGLVNVEVRGFKRRYVASPPSALRTILSQKLTMLDESIEDFSALFNLSGQGSVIRHYEGLAAIKGLYEELLQSVHASDPYYVLTDLAKWQSLDGRFFSSIVKRRAQKNVELRILTTPSKVALQRQSKDPDYGSHFRVLPQSMTINTNMIITPRYLAFHQLVSPLDAILLNNKSIITTQMEMFKVLWNTCATLAS